MSHFPTDIVYAFKVHRTSTKLNKRGKNFAVVYLPFHASPDNLTLETVFSKIGVCSVVYRVRIPENLFTLIINEADSSCLLHLINSIVLPLFKEEYFPGDRRLLLQKKLKPCMIGGGVIQQRVNEFASKLTVNNLRNYSKIIQSNTQPGFMSNCSYEYFVLHMNGMIEHKENLTSLMISSKYSKHTPLPIAVDMVKFYDPRLFSLDSMLVTPLIDYVREQFQSSLSRPFNPQLSLSFPWLKETLLNMLMHYFPAFHQLSSVKFVSEDQLSPFSQWAKYWPELEETCKSYDGKGTMNTLDKKRKFQQMIDSIFLGLSASFVDANGSDSCSFQQFITGIVKHLDGIPSLPHMTSLLDGLNSTLNYIPMDTYCFAPSTYRGNWESAKDYSVVANRYDFSDFMAHNNHCFLTETQLAGGGQESLVLSRSSQQKHKLAMLLTQSDSLNEHRANPFKRLNSKHPHVFGSSKTLRLLDHELRLPHVNTKYCYPVFSDIFPKHLMKEKSMLFHVHPLPTRTKLQTLLPSTYRKHGFVLNPSLKIHTVRQLHKHRKRTLQESNSINVEISLPKKQKQQKQQIHTTVTDQVVSSVLNEQNNEETNTDDTQIDKTNDQQVDQQEIMLAQEDESAIMAGVDVEVPSFDLLDYIREIAAMKIPLRSSQVQKLNIEDLVHVLERKFSSSALVAIGIFVEEIIREQMKIWYQSGYPLLLMDDEDHHVLKAAIRSQASGSPYLEDDLIISLLKNRLEALFGMNMDSYVSFIAQTRNEMLTEQTHRQDELDRKSMREYLHGGGTVLRQSTEKLKLSEHYYQIPPFAYSKPSWNRIQREAQIPSYSLPKSVKELRKSMLSGAAEKRHSIADVENEFHDNEQAKKRIKVNQTDQLKNVDIISETFIEPDTNETDDEMFARARKRKRFISVTDFDEIDETL